jgi:hypothetical protein
MGLARGSSIAAVETTAFPLAGWAAYLGAWDLVAEERTAPLPESVRDAVDRLKFYGNNGFGDSFGKQQAGRILGDLVGSQREALQTLPGAVLGAGVSARGVANLRRLMTKVAGYVQG